MSSTHTEGESMGRNEKNVVNEQYRLGYLIRGLWKKAKQKKCKKYESKIAFSLLAILVLSYTVLLSTYSILRHITFYTQVYDLGLVDQFIWEIGNGSFFNTLRGMNFWGHRLNLIYFLLAPVYWIWNDVKAILILQSIALALGALPLFLVARETLKDYWLALALAAAYLLYAALSNLNIDHIHPEPFATPMLLFGFYFAMRARWKLFLLCCFLVLLCKEDATFTLMALGLFVAYRWDWRPGLTVSVVAAAWLVIGMKVIMPHFIPPEVEQLSHYGWFGGWIANFWNPSWYIATIFQKSTAIYAFKLLAPVGFVSLLAPTVLLIALPSFLVNVFGSAYLITIDYHYTAYVTPFIFLSAVFGLERLLRMGTLRVPVPTVLKTRRNDQEIAQLGFRLINVCWRPFLRLVLIAGLLICALWTNTLWSHLPLFQTKIYLQSRYDAYRNDPNVLANYQALALIPKDVPVSADYTTAPHLTHRKKVYMFPNPFIPEAWGYANENPHDPAEVQYVLANLGTQDAWGRQLLSNLETSGLFEKILMEHQTLLLKRARSDLSESLVTQDAQGLVGRFYSLPNGRNRLMTLGVVPPTFQAVFPRIDFPLTTGTFQSSDGIDTSLVSTFQAAFTGFLKVATPGLYQFDIKSDDGFRLTVNGTVVAEFDRIRGFEKGSTGSIELEEGEVPIRLDYFQHSGRAGLVLSYTPPEGSSMIIPPAVLRAFPTSVSAAKPL